MSPSHSRKSLTPYPRSAEIIKVCSKLNASFIFCDNDNNSSALTRSILLMASATVRPSAISPNSAKIRSTPSVTPLCASINKTITSASAAPPHAAATIARSSRRRGLNRPGVSTKTICASPSIATPLIRARVVCTLCVTIETLAPTIWFNSVDLPAFGSPISATKPAFVMMLPTFLIGLLPLLVLHYACCLQRHCHFDRRPV